MEGPVIWLTLFQAPCVGRHRLSILMRDVPDPHEAWLLSRYEMMRLEDWGPASAEGVMSVRSDRSARASAEREWEQALERGLRFIARADTDYPQNLLLTPSPPPFLYQAGPWRPDSAPIISIVGTRRATPYGLSAAYRFGHELARAGAVVVSGMARGIDAAAHRGALEAGGTTIAVLGSGADVCYPPESRGLYRQIREQGAILSELPPGTGPRREFFPDRNRIISGISHGVLAVEAGEKSGTLITVKSALEQGREVFGVPGPITSPVSAGIHAMIRDGGRLVASAADLLEDLGFLSFNQERLAVRLLPDEEQQVLQSMGEEPRWAGDLAEVCGLTAGEVQGVLTMLELKGLARRIPGGQYIRTG